MSKVIVNGYYLKLTNLVKVSEAKKKVLDQCIETVLKTNSEENPVSYFIAQNTLLKERILILAEDEEVNDNLE